jgi:lecithin-cholesterol acyltransferase
VKTKKTTILALILIAVLLVVSGTASTGSFHEKRPARLTPVVIFPGWGVTRLEVTVHNQVVAPGCPRSGSFEYSFVSPVSSDFNQACRDRLLTLTYKFDATGAPHPSEQQGVQVRIADYGKTESSPVFEPMYVFLEQNGYTRNQNLVVAGYDFRLTPDMGGFMEKTTALIEQTYRNNHNTPVHLVAHSNGPLYAQYLLTHVSQQWKNKYIQGYTSLAGNYPGQGLQYSFLFTGIDIPAGIYPADAQGAAISARMIESWPSTYITAADPAYFGDREVVIRVGENGKAYTPKDARQLFSDAGLTLASKISPFYFGCVKFQAPNFPNVDVYAEKGSGLDTAVGVQLPDLTVGQLLDDSTVFIFASGDTNQEDWTNASVQAWQAMPCYHFELNDNPGVDHFSLAGTSQPVLDRLLAHLKLSPTICR